MPSYKKQTKKEDGPDPGLYDGHLTKFGSINQKVNFGSKYEFKVNDVPPPGKYDPSSGEKLIRPKSPSAFIRERLIPERDAFSRKETMPENYIGHQSASSRITTRVDFGRKYEFKPDKNPAPG